MTQTPGKLAWIINHQATNNTFKMIVRKAATAQVSNLTVQFR
jgi:hypothetical protein